MSETKFTPGPWIKRGKGTIETSGWAEVAAVMDGQMLDRVDHETQEANAHLIAAAPDMYEELECARDVFRFYQSHHEFKGGTEKAIRNKEIADRIDRLLAKARGEA